MFVLTTLVVTLLCDTALAAGSIKVPGLGSTKCEDVTKVGESGWRNKARRTELAGWSQGYFSGLMISYTMQIASIGGARQNNEIILDYDSEGHWAWLVDHCRANPSDSLAEAVMALFQEAISD
jgi:hypothetical protein